MFNRTHLKKILYSEFLKRMPRLLSKSSKCAESVKIWLWEDKHATNARKYSALTASKNGSLKIHRVHIVRSLTNKLTYPKWLREAWSKKLLNVLSATHSRLTMRQKNISTNVFCQQSTASWNVMTPLLLREERKLYNTYTNNVPMQSLFATFAKVEWGENILTTTSVHLTQLCK